MRALLTAIHAAAGNKRGARSASQWHLLAREAQPVRLEAAVRQFPVGPEGLITPDMIEQRKRERGLI